VTKEYGRPRLDSKGTIEALTEFPPDEKAYYEMGAKRRRSDWNTQYVKVRGADDEMRILQHG